MKISMSRVSGSQRVPLRKPQLLFRVGAVLMVASLSRAVAEPVFSEVAATAGIDFVHGQVYGDSILLHNGDVVPGMALGDYDNDGDDDLYFCNGNGFSNALFRNNGDGSFTELTTGLGADLAMTAKESKTGLFFDYDGDGWLDLFVVNDGDPPVGGPEPTEVFHKLFHNNGNGTFSDVTDSMGIEPHPYRTFDPPDYTVLGSLQAGDINNDGWLDLYICYWQDYDVLLINDEGQGFTDVSDHAGIDFLDKDSWSTVFYDFNHDGLMDIHVAVDFTEDLLLINQGLNESGWPSFADIAAEAGIDSTWSEMGTAFGDIDNDGDFDMYLTNITQPSDGSLPSAQWHRLYLNYSSGDTVVFQDMDDGAGNPSIAQRAGWGWGCTFVDYDHDGWQDIAVVNGMPLPLNGHNVDKSRLFRNDGNPPDITFTDVSVDANFNDTRIARSLAAFDYDRDGDRDLIVTNYAEQALLYRNDGGAEEGHWLVVDLVGDAPNKRGIGATVRISVDGQQQQRYIGSATSFLSQEPDEAHFGLGSHTIVDAVTVDWPDGTKDVATDVSADQLITILEGQLPPVGVIIALRLIGPATINAGAVGTYSSFADRDDGSSDDVTSQATWTVNPVEAGTFTSPGVFSANALVGVTSQSATLTAQYETHSMSAVVDIVDPTIFVDVTPPDIVATFPPVTYETESTTVQVLGTSSDDYGVVSVVWSSDQGTSGPCSGLENWTTPAISLSLGLNNITVTAFDAEGNAQSVAVAVTRGQPEVNPDPNGNTPEPNTNEDEPNTNTEPNINLNFVVNENENDNLPLNENEQTNSNNSNENRRTGGGSSACGLFGFVMLGATLTGLALLKRRG